MGGVGRSGADGHRPDLCLLCLHMRFWVVPVLDARGNCPFWIGGTANRNRDAFEHKFKNVVEQIQKN